MIVTAAFVLLMLATWARAGVMAHLRRRTTSEWVLDLSGLTVQGTLIPLAEVGLVAAGLAALAPELKGSLHPSAPLAFALNFVAVDYLYYWNHRALHARALWPLHAVHHGARELDVLVTSRNTLWTPLLIVYVWLNGAALWLLADPAPYLAAAALTASLDLWRHSRLFPRARWVRALLVTPEDHAWHHSRDRAGCNFGANLNLWDRLHGTWYAPGRYPEALGIDPGLGLAQSALLPLGLWRTRA